LAYILNKLEEETFPIFLTHSMGAVFKCILAAIVVATAAAGPPLLPSIESPPPLPPQAKVELGKAGGFAILTASGITNVASSAITGNIGCSPIAGTAMTGWSLIMDSTKTFSTSTQVTGKAYGADYATPTPSELTIAIADMQTAYTDAASRHTSNSLIVEHLNVKGGLVSGMTFTAGVYTWATGINFASDIYIKGNATDQFIFQTTGNVLAGTGARVHLLDQAKAENIVWQVAGFFDAGVGSHLEGIILVKTHAAFKTGSSINGRILAQTACTLDRVTVTEPP
jgi:hypothetical protein